MVFVMASVTTQAQTKSILPSTDFGEFRLIASTDRVNRFKIGARFSIGQKIRVSARSYVALMHQNGGTIEIHKAGVYSVDQLRDQLLEYQRQQANQHLTLQMNNQNKRSYIQANYPVSTPIHRCVPTDLRFLMPESFDALHPRIKFLWTHDQSSVQENYQLTILNEFGEVLEVYQTKDTTFVVNFEKYKQERGIFFLGALKHHKQVAEKVVIVYPTKELSKQNLALFQVANKRKNRPLQALFLEVFFLENHKLLYLARKAFQQLLQKYPHYKILRRAFYQFNYRNGFIEGYHTLKVLKVGEKSVLD